MTPFMTVFYQSMITYADEADIFEIFKLFLDNGTDIYATDDNGISGLDLICKRNYWIQPNLQRKIIKYIFANQPNQQFKLVKPETYETLHSVFGKDETIEI
jgi:hypothetical protein